MTTISVNSLNNPNITFGSKLGKNTLSPCIDLGKRTSSKNIKSFIGLGLAALSSYGIYFATKGKIKPKNKIIDTIKIEPRSIVSSHKDYNCPKFLNKYVDDVDYSKGIMYAKIKPEHNPITLDIVSGTRKTLHASNFAPPYGTNAVTSKLDETLSTSGLLQCSAISVVDRKHNLQTLIHCCPTVSGNEDLLKYIFSHSNPKDLEIMLVPGCYKETDTTVDFLVDFIKKNASEAKFNFANFPNDDTDVLILYNGILKSGTSKNIQPIINPSECMIHV